MLVVGLAALGIIVLATLWLNTRAERHLEDSVAATVLRQSAEGLRGALLGAEASQRGYVLTGNEIYLSPYDAAQTSALEELERIRTQLGARPDKARLVADLSRVVTAKLAEMRTLIALKSERRDAEIWPILNTNAGKALMDEASVYLNGISLEADENVEAGIREQSENALLLRAVSLLAVLVIALVAGVMAVVVRRYAADILAARNAIAAANETLELRVVERTAQLSQARDRAEMLLAEVNHRVSNSLSLVTSLIRLQLRAMKDNTARKALEQTEARIQAIAQMHKMLFTSGAIGEVAADQYLNVVMQHLRDTVGAERGGIRLQWQFEPLTLSTSDAIHCGIIATEWVTNAYKYAYPEQDGAIRVRLAREGGAVVLSVTDDGVGGSVTEPAKGTGLGTRVVAAIASQMQAQVEHRDGDPGFEARLTLLAKEHAA